MAENEIDVSDDEINSLMAELEEESLKIVEDQAFAKTVGAATVLVSAAEHEEHEEIESAIGDGKVAVVEEELSDDDLAELEEVVEAESVVATPEEVAPVAAAKVKPVDVEEVAAKPAKVAVAAPTSDEEDVAAPVGAGTLHHFVDAVQFRKDTAITEASLDTCMIQQNGLRAYYGATAARAEAQHDRLKARFEVVEATLFDQHRKELALTGEKVTEKMVETAVKMDPRWFKAKNTIIEAGTIASINKQLVESLKDRRDMIIQLGADRRDEHKGQARILVEKEERESLRDRALKSATREAA